MSASDGRFILVGSVQRGNLSVVVTWDVVW